MYVITDIFSLQLMTRERPRLPEGTFTLKNDQIGLKSGNK